MPGKQLEVKAEAHGAQTWIYRLSGSLYGSAAGYAFQDEVRQRIAAGARGIVVDLSAVDKIDSSGIGILVAVMWSASRGNAGLVLAALSERVEQLLSIAMLLEHIDHAPSVEAALEKLGRMDLRP